MKKIVLIIIGICVFNFVGFSQNGNLRSSDKVFYLNNTAHAVLSGEPLQGPPPGSNNQSKHEIVSLQSTVHIDRFDKNDGNPMQKPWGPDWLASYPGIVFGQVGAKERIGSKRTQGVGRYGLDFITNGFHRLHIDNDGSVGIGTELTNPNAKFHVLNTDSKKNPTAFFNTVKQCTGNAEILGISNLMQVSSCPSGRIVGIKNQLPQDCSGEKVGIYNYIHPSDRVFTDNIGVDNIIDASGQGRRFGLRTQVGRWQSPDQSNPTNQSPIYGVYSSVGNHQNDWAGFFSGKVFATSIVLGSDQKLKKEIKDLPYSLDIINKLAVKTYLFDTEKYKNMGLPNTKQIGFIAQDVERILPELVVNVVNENFDIDKNGNKIERKETFKGINYTMIIPLLTQAIQEQQKMIKELQVEINSLKNRK